MAALPLEGWGLASVRQTKGISLEEIARDTKLRVATLQAIEDGHFENLPGGIYNISYLRQYARAIGADESELVERYRTRCAGDSQVSGTPS
jgi:cytoskeleton protein RodZ